MTTNEAREQPLAFLEDVYERSHRRLRTVAARYVPNDAEDAVHDAFVRALEGAASFRHNATPHTWLHRITVNACIDHWRKRRRWGVENLERARRFRSHGHATDLSAGVIVRAALKSLSPFDRRLCVLRFVHGYSYREIANRLGVPEGTVKSRVSYARARLRDKVSGRLRTTHERRVTLRKRDRSSRLNPNVA
jgi:RNA polymerase sigma-70 factor (ECF subfamily)